MEHQKILYLLNGPNNSKFVRRTWNIFNDEYNANYLVGNEIIYNIEVLKSNLCDYNDTYILGKSDIVTKAHIISTQVAFKYCAPFINVSQKLMEQRQMMLKIQIQSCHCTM